MKSCVFTNWSGLQIMWLAEHDMVFHSSAAGMIVIHPDTAN